jgi:hypothetical protein
MFSVALTVYRFHARDLHLVRGRHGKGRGAVPRVGRRADPGGCARPRPKPIIERQFEIEFLDAGVETFGFTVG